MSTEALLLDRAQLLNLTGAETTASLAGVVLALIMDNNHGVFTQRKETLAMTFS